jgi:hypothetical protein
MLPTSSQTDPIVEILRLAYRRGLAIRQEQARAQVTQSIESKSTDSQPAEDLNQDKEGNNVAG